MPLIVICLSYPVSVSSVGAADLNLRHASTLAIAEWFSKIPGRAYCLFEYLNGRLSNNLGSRGLSLEGVWVQLCTYRLIPVLAQDCEFRVSSCTGLWGSALGDVPLRRASACEISGTVNWVFRQARQLRSGVVKRKFAGFPIARAFGYPFGLMFSGFRSH